MDTGEGAGEATKPQARDALSESNIDRALAALHFASDVDLDYIIKFAPSTLVRDVAQDLRFHRLLASMVEAQELGPERPSQERVEELEAEVKKLGYRNEDLEAWARGAEERASRNKWIAVVIAVILGIGILTQCDVRLAPGPTCDMPGPADTC